MKLSKKKKICILIIIVVILMIGFIFITRKTTNELLKNYIKNKDFKLNVESNLYEKRLSKIDISEYYSLVDNLSDANYKILYFDTKTFTLLKDQMDYSNGITYIFNGTYNYKDELLTYVYEVSMGEAIIMFEGIFNDDNLSCDVVYSNNVDPYENKQLFCDNVRYEVEDFGKEIRELITDPSLLEKIKVSK